MKTKQLRAAHTPGPWVNMTDRLEVHADGRAIANINCSHIADEAIDANARLIAAAPELLEALRTAHYQIRNRHAELQISHGDANDRTKECLEHLESIREAIAKAEGK
jgi:hypothetical protein